VGKKKQSLGVYIDNIALYFE